MPLSRRSFLVQSTGLLAAASLGSLPDLTAIGAPSNPSPITLPPTTLHGYGTISAVFRPLHGGQSSLTHIKCESAQKALLLQAKYLSDLGLLPGTTSGVLSLDGSKIPVHGTTAGGAVACYARGSEVLILAALSADGLTQILTEFVPHPIIPSNFESRTQVPMYLDRWDKYGLLIYYGPFTAPPEVPFPGSAYNYLGDLEFVRDNNTGLVLWGNASQMDTPEGATNEQWWAWLQEHARTMGVPVHLNTNNNWPILWLSNRFRDETQLKMPQFMGGYYDVGWMSGTQGAISYNSQAGEDALLGVQQQIVRRFAKDPNIVGWLEPHGETSQLPMSLMTEYGPVADGSLRTYLKERFGKLSTVSQRWHGDPAHLKSWNDIRAPEIAEFAGFGPEAIDLRGTWRVKYITGADGKPASTPPPEWYTPGFDDSAWDQLVAPGNDRMIRMPRTPLVFRRTVDVPAAWLAAKPEITLYVWDMSDRPQDELIVYVNGARVTGQARIGLAFRWAVLNVTRAIKPGANSIVINEPKGVLCYRIYLTTAPPRQYPELGPQKNAQWADYNAWTLWSREAHMRRGVEMIRQVDPDRSINFMSPGDDTGPVRAISKDYGCRFHDTGAMAGFWTDENSLMMAGAGLPTTAEPGGGAPNIAEFQKYWGRWITEGVNGVHYFQHLGEIIWNPPILAEFKKNRAMYEAIGKYHVPFAEVAVLYSTRNHRLTAFPWDFRVTDQFSPAGYYSVANAAAPLLDFCPRDGITEEDMGASLAQKYRFVIDTNTAFVDDTLLAGIESYVRSGGVFISNGQTGRHTEIEPNTWPISKLTGYTVTNPQVYSAGLTITPAPGQNILVGPAWTGRRAGGFSIKKASPDAQDLLLWSDGSVAIGMRPLGKGWIVHVGPGWANADEAMLLRPLLTHFGIRNLVPAAVTGAPGLHFRHFIGNTGLQDLWALFNEGDGPITTDLSFGPGVHPPSLADIVTGETIPIVRNDTGDMVRGIALAGHQTVMYVSPRPDPAASPLEWLTLQRGWWQGTMKPPAKRLPTPADQQRFTLDITQNWAYKQADDLNDEAAAALAQPAIDDSAWERRDQDMWMTPDNHKFKRIIMRRKFTVPPAWKTGSVYLSAGGTLSGARTFLNGKPMLGGRSLRDGASMEDCGGVLKPGTSHVLTLDITSSDPPIGVKEPTWLSYVPDPLARQDLSGAWTGYSDAIHATGPVTIPGPAANINYLGRTVTIDRAHAGQNVVIYVSAGGGFNGVLINGSRLDHNGRTSDHTYAWFNVTPMVRWGEENTVELCLNPDPNATNFKVVELRYYQKGYFP